jgi:hypothetical protein
VDELSSLGQTLPWMGLVVALATIAALFLAFGSVVLPVKAIVANVLSVGWPRGQGASWSAGSFVPDSRAGLS